MMITRRERPDLGAAGMNGLISNPGHTDRRDAKEMICHHATYWFYTTLKSCSIPLSSEQRALRYSNDISFYYLFNMLSVHPILLLKVLYDSYDTYENNL